MVSVESQGHMREKELAIVEEKLCEVENIASLWAEEARALRTRKNALQPFFRISLEILQEIFFLLSSGEIPLLEQSENRTIPWDWVVVTWVCHYWREAAIGFPKLWNAIKNFNDVGRIQAYLARSRNMHLVVHLGMMPFSPDGLPLGALNLIRAHIGRITDLALGFSEFTFDIFTLMDIFASDTFPLVKRLQLCNNFPSTSSIEIGDTIRPSMTLNSLHLKGIHVDWKHGILQGLSELHIEKFEVFMQPSLKELLAILRTCPKLRMLKLIDAGPAEIEEISETAEVTVSLPFLSYIKVGTLKFQSCGALFDKLNLPKNVIWDIAISDYPTDVFLDPMSPNLLNIDRGYKHVTVTIENDRLIFESIGEEDLSPIRFSIVMKYDEIFRGEPFGSLGSILRSYLWYNANSVTVIVAATGFEPFDRDFIEDDAWGGFFMDFDMFESLTLCFTSQRDLENSCLQKFSRIFSVEPPSYFCENLKALKIESALFDTEWNDEKDTFTFLTEHLVLRNKDGRRLETLSFLDCEGIGEERICHLRNLDVCDEIHYK